MATDRATAALGLVGPVVLKGAEGILVPRGLEPKVPKAAQANSVVHSRQSHHRQDTACQLSVRRQSGIYISEKHMAGLVKLYTKEEHQEIEYVKGRLMTIDI